MKRYYHYMQPTNSDSWPRNVLCVAVQSKTEKRPGLAGVRREVLVGWSVLAMTRRDDSYVLVRQACGRTADAFWSLMMQATARPGNTWVICYRANRAWSLLNFWEEIERGFIKLTGKDYRSPEGCAPDARKRPCGYLVLEDPPCIAAFRLSSGAGRVTWVDSRNYGTTFPEEVAAKPELANHLAWWLSDFCQAAQQYKLGALKATAGSQALYTFRRSYLKDKVYVHNNVPLLRLESKGYFGGRCEAFRTGAIQGPCWHLDFRSLYPYCCIATALPARLVDYREDVDWAHLDSVPAGTGVIADVTVETDEPAYPWRRDHDTFWPTGRFRAVLCGPELEDARHLGRIVQVHAIAFYETEPVLKGYALALYDLRCQAEAAGKPSLAATAKALLVALPGKFAQRSRQWVWEDSVWADVQYGLWHGKDKKKRPCRYRAIGGLVQREEDLGWAYESCPAIAAFITAAGRMRLLEAIRAAGWENVFYVDTDSLLVNDAGYDALWERGWIRDRILGYLYVKSGPVGAHVHGIKHYELDGALTCAGQPKGTEVKDADPNHYWYALSAAAQLSSGQRPSTLSVRQSYVRAAPYRHGIVEADGRVAPFHLGG